MTSYPPYMQARRRQVRTRWIGFALCWLGASILAFVFFGTIWNGLFS